MAEVDDSLKLNKPNSEALKSIYYKSDKIILPSAKHVLRKKQPFKLKKSGKDIYVNNKTPFKVGFVLEYHNLSYSKFKF